MGSDVTPTGILIQQQDNDLPPCLFLFSWSTAVSESNSLLEYTWKLNFTEKEAVCSLGIVYGELNQDGTPAESRFSEMVANMDF